MLRERLGAFLTLIVAVGLLVLAVPRLGSSLAKLPGDPGVDLLNQGQFLSADTLGRILSSRQAAQRWLDDPSTDYELGLTFYGASRQTGDPISRARFLLEAVKDFRTSLRERPADPYAWGYIALAYTELGDSGNAVAMLQAAYDFGPFMPEIAMMRSYVAIRNWDALDNFARLLASDDFVQAMTRDPSSFVQLAVSAKFEKEARLALAASPDLLVQFDNMAKRGGARHMTGRLRTALAVALCLAMGLLAGMPRAYADMTVATYKDARGSGGADQQDVLLAYFAGVVDALTKANEAATHAGAPLFCMPPGSDGLEPGPVQSLVDKFIDYNIQTQPAFAKSTKEISVGSITLIVLTSLYPCPSKGDGKG